jgi:mannose-6-phosphate isomerase-like protein (cupin superfamily)
MPVALVHKPWGHFRRLHGGPGFQVKELAVRPGGIISLQRHRWRSEHWVCVAGEGLATWGDEKVALLPDVALSIPQGALHRIENTGDAWLKVIEVQLGSYLGEDDIERVEDAYGRV